MSKQHAIKSRNYPSKLMLFGEYTVLMGSMSLALPLSNFDLQKASNGKNNFNGLVRSICDFLVNQDFSNWNVRFDVGKYQDFFESGNYFYSDIPVGYGVGSSGAVSAAIFDLFFNKDIDDLDANSLRMVLGQIENFFHGKSSGIDPLISYLNQAFIGLPDGSLDSLKFDPSFLADFELTLIDSGISRSTSEYVNIFRQKAEDELFVKSAIEPLISINNSLISAVLKQELMADLPAKLNEISAIQFEFFREMIPDHIYSVWHKSLNDPDQIIKLCGAGGGGFFLLFSRNIEKFSVDHPKIKTQGISL